MEQWYSDAYFTRRQIHVIRKDVRFTLKGRRNNNRNYSLSSSHARTIFEIFFDHFDGDYHSLAAVTSITLENEIRFSKHVFQQHMVTCGYPTVLHMCWYCTETFRNRKKRFLIDRFMNRIGILRRVCVFNSVSFFKQLFE